MKTTKPRKQPPTKLELLNMTGCDTIKAACEVLGVNDATYRKWRINGMSERVYKKHFGDRMSEKARKKYWSDYDKPIKTNS